MIFGRISGEAIASGLCIDDLLIDDLLAVLAKEFATLVIGDLIDRIPDV